MKLNNGKGWEAVKSHSSHHLYNVNAVPNSSQRAIGGGHDTPRGPQPQGISATRLNAPQPPPPSPQKPGVTKTRERLGASGATPLKRQSAAVGGVDVATPTASTQAQFQNSTANLPGRGMSHPMAPPQTTTQQGGMRIPSQENKSTGMQKFMRTICCSR